MNVCWTDESYEVLKRIREFISRDSDFLYVERMRGFWITRPTFVCSQNQEEKVSESNALNSREVLEGNYRIMYKIKRNSIDKNGKAMDSEPWYKKRSR